MCFLYLPKTLLAVGPGRSSDLRSVLKARPRAQSSGSPLSARIPFGQNKCPSRIYAKNPFGDPPRNEARRWAIARISILTPRGSVLFDKLAKRPMNEKEFVQKRKGDWDRLLLLVSRAEAQLTALNGQEVREFGRLYRAAAQDLAAVKTRSQNETLHTFLNDLVARCYSVLYRHPRSNLLYGFINAIAEACRAVRRRRRQIATAMAIFLLSAIFARQAVRADKSLTKEILPPGFEAALESWKTKEFKEVRTDEAVVMTAFYVQNNTMATIHAAAGGVTFGGYTVYSLYTNGAMMGAFYEELSKVGGTRHFLTGIAAHGVSELGGIFIGAGAGLLLGWCLIAPGRRTRAQALRAASKDVIHLLILGIVMIWVAAPIEAWISFGKTVPDWLKLSIAAVTLAIWLSLFLLFGKNSSEKSPNLP